MLADGPGGNEDLHERDGVVGQEIEAEQVLRLQSLVDDARDVYDQADGLWSVRMVDVMPGPSLYSRASRCCLGNGM